jgi:hypothetical protein
MVFISPMLLPEKYPTQTKTGTITASKKNATSFKNLNALATNFICMAPFVMF